MNYTHSLLLAVLLSGICAANVLIPGKLSAEEHRKIADESTRGNDKLKLNDLYYDLLFLIFNYADLGDLLSLAEIKPRFAAASSAIFSRRYTDYEIEISIADNFVRVKLTDDWQLKRIVIGDFDTGLKMLEHFGFAFKNLLIQNIRIDIEKSSIINRYVNKYASNSLIRLELNSLKENSLEQFDEPFKQVEDLSVDISTNEIRNGSLQMNELFPKLRFLRLYLRLDIDNSLFSSAYSNLEYLFLTIAYYTRNKNDRNEERLEELIRNNPRIRSIEIDHFPANLAKTANEFLPKLENLTIYSTADDDRNNSICFQHVRRFKLNNYYPKNIGLLSFGRLESIQIQYSPTLFDAWIKFFKQHTFLTELHLEIFHKADSPQLVELVGELPNLDRLTIGSFDFLSVDVVKQIIESHERLTKFRFTVHEFNEIALDVLRKEFESDWHIQESDVSMRTGFLFERISV